MVVEEEDPDVSFLSTGNLSFSFSSRGLGLFSPLGVYVHPWTLEEYLEDDQGDEEVVRILPRTPWEKRDPVKE